MNASTWPALLLAPGREGAADRSLLPLLRTVFPRAEEAEEWLRSPSPGLRGRRPLDLLREGKQGEVTALLATLESGAFL